MYNKVKIQVAMVFSHVLTFSKQGKSEQSKNNNIISNCVWGFILYQELSDYPPMQCRNVNKTWMYE